MKLDELKNDCMKALRCLYIAVESPIADDVNAKVKAYIDALARDGFIAGAEAQKIAAVKKVERLMAPMGHYLLPSVIAAIRSATVKWEVPGE